MKKILLLPIILILFGCPQKRTGNMPLSIKWKIVKYSASEENLNELDNYIDFSTDNKGVASVGCNTINFTFSKDITKSELKVENIFSTRMYCENLAKTETNLKTLLKQISTYRVEGNQLFLTGDNGVFIECAKR